jgi:hypothetical protein
MKTQLRNLDVGDWFVLERNGTRYQVVRKAHGKAHAVAIRTAATTTDAKETTLHGQCMVTKLHGGIE